MANLSTQLASAVLGLLTQASNGTTTLQINALAQELEGVPAVQLGSVQVGNTPADILDRSLAVQYPTVSVYCEKMSNSLKEKFRTFSGTATLAIEVRHSQDQIQSMQSGLEAYVSAVCQILDSSRGDWGNGAFYAGGYDVSFGPVKQGGKNLLQTGKVSFNVDVSY